MVGEEECMEIHSEGQSKTRVKGICPLGEEF